MKTVLFVDGAQLNTSFEHVRQLFRELDAYGQVVVCPWDSSAYSPHLVNSALTESIGEGEAWQAVVICDLSRESLADYAFDLWAEGEPPAGSEPLGKARSLRRLEPLVPYLDDEGRAMLESLGAFGPAMAEPMPSFVANPFDFVRNMHLKTYPAQIQHPVVRLGHLLLGLPAHVLDDGCVGLSASQVDEVTAQVLLDVEQGKASPDPGMPFDLWVHERVLERAREAHPDTTVNDYSPAELTLKCQRPDSLAYVTFRDIPDNVSGRALETENGDLGSVRSEFAVRNHFADKARFVVFDRTHPGGERRVREEMSFWSAVLLLCVNELRSLGLRSYALHRMAVGVDFDAYSAELSEKYGYALSARNLLEERLASIETSLQADDRLSRDLPVYEEFIHVDFKVDQYDDLAIPTKRYGWLKDSDKPYDSGIRNLGHGIGRIPHRMGFSHAYDEQYFAKDRAMFDEAMEEALEEPRHALEDAATDFRALEPFDDDILTGFKANSRQVARLEGELTDIEGRLAGGYALSILDKGVYDKVMAIVDERVNKRLSTRAYARQVVLVALATVIACAIAFVPFVFGLMGGEGFSRPALAVSIVCLLAILIVGFIPLKLSHREVKRMLEEVNGRVRGMLDELKEKAQSLSGRISDYASYRKGYSLLARQGEERRPYTKESRELRQMRRDVDELTEGLAEDLDALGMWPVVSTEDKFLSWGQAKAAIEDVDFFSLRTSPVHLDRPYNMSRRSGMSVKSPFQFIEWFDIEDVCVFEPGYERGSGNDAS